MTAGPMETMTRAIARLESQGYDESFRAGPKGVLLGREEEPLEPEAMIVEETVRFEGASDPADSAILLALRTRDGRHRGTFVANFGPDTDPRSAAALHRLSGT